MFKYYDLFPPVADQEGESTYDPYCFDDGEWMMETEYKSSLGNNFPHGSMWVSLPGSDRSTMIGHVSIYLIAHCMVKNQGALNELISYFERKGQYMTCYALRRRAGLRNSSNGSENVNQITVAKRQKHNYESWREDGSSSVSNMSALYANGEDKLWFQTGKVTFNIQYKKKSVKKAEA